jgi:hypothetical protein
MKRSKAEMLRPNACDKFFDGRVTLRCSVFPPIVPPGSIVNADAEHFSNECPPRNQLPPLGLRTIRHNPNSAVFRPAAGVRFLANPKVEET